MRRLLESAAERAITYLEGLDDRPVAPSAAAVVGLSALDEPCLLYTSPSPRDRTRYRMPSSA